MRNNDQLWAADPQTRLQAARALDGRELEAIRQELLQGCPQARWPYGCNTSINPWVVFLGPSPGNSPEAGDQNFSGAREGVWPTAGTPVHAFGEYHDPKGFFVKLRQLAISIVSAASRGKLAGRDALALAGMMNLDSGASGEASQVVASPKFAEWVVNATFRRLRPRWVIGLGLKGFLQKNPAIERIVSSVGASTGIRQVAQEFPFRGYSQKAYKFEIRPVAAAPGMRQHFVFFPQHPSRAPMTNAEVWQKAVDEFVELARRLDA
jgi:hypothetical protein